MLKVAWTPEYAHPLPEGHRFPMEKYDSIPETLLREGTIAPTQLFCPSPVDDDIVTQIHSKKYLDRLRSVSLSKKEERRTGFPLSEALVYRERIIVQGTIDCCVFALENGIAMNVAGGTHHAYAAHGEGFCLLNDIAVSSVYMLQTKRVSKVLIVDLDVHQGNGSARLLQGNDAIFTFSMHGRNNYPMHKERSDLDIPLEDGTNDSTYLHILRESLPQLIDKIKPDLVHYQSGVDVLDSDKLGRLSLTPEGCKDRDEYVLSTLHKLGIPVVCTMGGGYSEDIDVIVDAHANTFRIAQDIAG